MISDPITDHKQAAILLRQVQFAWTALGKKNRSQDPLEEIVAEWNAGTGEIEFSRCIGDREFNWLPKGKELVEKLTGKSFRSVPEMVSFRAEWEIDLTDRSLDKFQYWMEAVERGDLDGSNLGLALVFIIPASDQQAQSEWSWRLRCGQTKRGRAETPFRHKVGAFNSVPVEVDNLIDQIGIDQELNRHLGDQGEETVDGDVKRGVRVALSRDRDSQLFARILTTLKDATVPGAKVSCTIYCGLNGYGHFLTEDSPNPEDIALEFGQKEKMDQFLKLILNSKSAKDWKLVINSASERTTCGAGWDRRGSVLEHHDTKIEVTRLRSGRKQHKMILHYRDGKYQIEIDGLDADSEAGRIFSGWGVPFR